MANVRRLDAGRFEVSLPLDAGNATFANIFAAAVRAGGEDVELVAITDLPGVPPRVEVTYHLASPSIQAAYDRVATLVAKLQNVLVGRRD